MLVINDIDSFQGPWEGCVVTMGNFDGLHIGHQKLIDSVLKLSSENGLESVLISYQPTITESLPQIVNREEKIEFLKEKGVSALVNITLDDKTKKLPAMEFLENVLLERLKAHTIIIGYDHAFGRNRQGDINFLREHAKKYDYTVYQIESVNIEGTPVSSSRIRENIELGNIENANTMLGRAYNIQSKVIHGHKRGKKFGIPTANLQTPEDKVLPATGVYFAMVKYDGIVYKGVVNIGTNPTFANKTVGIEVHFLDFSKDIYNEIINVSFIARLRDEIKFENIEKLKEQIAVDIEQAENISLENYNFTIS